jgi:hypothetical protein
MCQRNKTNREDAKFAKIINLGVLCVFAVSLFLSGSQLKHHMVLVFVPGFAQSVPIGLDAGLNVG